MKGFWWKLPLLRGLSPMRRGVLEPVVVVVIASGLCLWAVNSLFPHPVRVCSDLAQLGATLLVAFAVETSWVLQHSRRRGSDEENWIGLLSGIGLCALVGIAIAFLLSDHAEPFGWIEKIGFAWSLVSIGALGLFIALQPFATYEWTHALSTEYPDE